MQSEQQQRIMGYFIEEAKDHLNTIEQGLLSLQSTIEDTEMLNEVFRAAHSVKGGAAMLGLDSIQQTSHRLEDYFKVLTESPVKPDHQLESLLLRVFDTLQSLVEHLQSPFGLTKEVANSIMSGVEPVFQELNTHMKGLAKGKNGAAAEATPTDAKTTENDEKNLHSTFKRDVLVQLREMLQLFKQADCLAHRQQLQEHCQHLERLGEQFNLPTWCELINTSSAAIATPTNSYRKLAGIVIKDIKQAQELVVENRAAEITVSDELKALVLNGAFSVSSEAIAVDSQAVETHTFSPRNGQNVTTIYTTETYIQDSDDESFSEEIDTAAIFSTSPPPASTQPTRSHSLSRNADPSGPEVGMAELNSLADLFEGEAPELDQTWQEEEIINLSDNPFTIDTVDFLDSDEQSDFSDLLGDLDTPTPTAPRESATDELRGLFGDDFLEEAPQNSENSLFGDDFLEDATPLMSEGINEPEAEMLLSSTDEFADLLFEDEIVDLTAADVPDSENLTDLFGDSFFEEEADSAQSTDDLLDLSFDGDFNEAEDDLLAVESLEDAAETTATPSREEASDDWLTDLDSDGSFEVDLANSDLELNELEQSEPEYLEATPEGELVAELEDLLDISSEDEADLSLGEELLWDETAEASEPDLLETTPSEDLLDISSEDEADLSLGEELLWDETAEASEPDLLETTPSEDLLNISSEDEADLSLGEELLWDETTEADSSSESFDWETDLSTSGEEEQGDLSLSFDDDLFADSTVGTDEFSLDGDLGEVLATEEDESSLFEETSNGITSESETADWDLFGTSEEPGLEEPELVWDDSNSLFESEEEAEFDLDSTLIGSLSFDEEEETALLSDSLISDEEETALNEPEVTAEAEADLFGFDLDTSDASAAEADLFGFELDTSDASAEFAQNGSTGLSSDAIPEADFNAIDELFANDDTEASEQLFEPDSSLDFDEFSLPSVSDDADELAQDDFDFSASFGDSEDEADLSLDFGSDEVDDLSELMSLTDDETALELPSDELSAPELETTEDLDALWSSDLSDTRVLDWDEAVEAQEEALDEEWGFDQNAEVAALQYLETTATPEETAADFDSLNEVLLEDEIESQGDDDSISLEGLNLEEDAPDDELEPPAFGETSDSANDWESLNDFLEVENEDSAFDEEFSLDIPEAELASLEGLDLEEDAPDDELEAAAFGETSDSANDWESLNDFLEVENEDSAFDEEFSLDIPEAELASLEGLDLEEDAPDDELEAAAFGETSDSANDWESLNDFLEVENEDFAFDEEFSLDIPEAELASLEDLDLEEDAPELESAAFGETSDSANDWESLNDFLEVGNEDFAFDEEFSLDIPEAEPALSAELDNSSELDELDAMLADGATASPEIVTSGEFDELEAMLGEDLIPTATPAQNLEENTLEAVDLIDKEFDDLESLLEQTDQMMGGPPSSTVQERSSLRPASRPRVRVFEQTTKVPVKHLDSLSNLVGELVVNRNSLEQDQERLRQFLDNLLHQVQQLSDVGARMQDLYERSLLESSLLASRQARTTFQADRNIPKMHATGIEYDPLEMDRFTNFHLISQETIELIVRVRESAADIEFLVDETDQVTRVLRQITTQLQEGLTRGRMTPFAQAADRLPRAVRDISAKLHKQAQLQVEGRETLIDKTLLEHLYDPLTHLVNNAITHGIETPDVRRDKGKPACGRITLRAFHQGNQTVISVSDDGAGIDPERVRAKAIEKGLISKQAAKNLSNLDLYDFLFHPGFSTKDQVDDFSGRGVGMDVVRTSLSEIRGNISIDSTLGKGTTFTVRLPLVLSICKALLALSDKARIAFPMDGVEDMFDVPSARIQTDAEGKTFVQWRDTVLPFQPLSDLLKYNRQINRSTVYGGQREDDMIAIVVLRSVGTYLAIQVDQVLGEQEIVIKQLEGPPPKPVGVAGATVLGDGQIMPIVDVLELIDLSVGRIRRDSGGTLWDQATTPPQEALAAKSEPMVLIVDDSITVRELLSLTFNKSGYRVEQARDGQEAWEKLRSGLPCDIVFCDIEMPRMDGLELLSRLQKDENLKDLPIAMLTSRGADRHRQMAAQLGASGYFTKPYLEEVLLDAAQRMIKGEVLISSNSNL
ncbi:MAG: response regulator [Kastovskya adunca ATA6-11-RM4]|jgi:chemosensory pili system protein ChpA (sensor histidine kinase/response regulator)|nr:response regulator [Kastovskya adunca ATA6-11-RM4]